MKDSLLNLQRGIGIKDYSSEAEEKRSRYHWHAANKAMRACCAIHCVTCVVCEPVWGQQQDGKRGRSGGGGTDSELVEPTPREQRSSPAHRGWTPPPPLEPRTGSAPFTHRTEVSPTSPRCSFSTPVGRTVFFFFFFSLISASYCKPWRPESRGEKGGTLLHAFRQPS